MAQMKVLLLFPPIWPPTNPHLAVPSLTAYLRARGIDVAQRDLNAEFFDAVLTRSCMDNALEQLRERFGPEGRTGSANADRPDPEFVRHVLEIGPGLATEVEAAKGVIRSAQFYDGPVGDRAMRVISDCLAIASLPFHPMVLRLQNCIPPMLVDNSRLAMAEVSNPRRNMFLDTFRNAVLGDIERERPDVVGISVPCMDQFLPALTLAHLLKVESRLPCHVTVGGPHVTAIREGLCKAPHLFDVLDSAIVFEGEIPLLRLVETLAAGKSLAKVPNLIYRDGDRMRVTRRARPEKMANLPLPDFSDLALERYLSPERILPLLSARGCYYGRCTFCNSDYGGKRVFSKLPAAQLADQMQELSKRYGVRHIYFVDEAITPSALKELPQLLVGSEPSVHWGGCVRVEGSITGEMRAAMYAAGCRLNLVGLESACDSVLARMRKGVPVTDMSRLLKDNTEVGIWNHAFFILGFPGEGLSEARRTLDFIAGHAPYIHSLAVSPFSLVRGSPVFRAPGSYGITRLHRDPERDLAIVFDYEVSAGMGQESAQQACSDFVESLPPLAGMQFYCSDAYRLLYASHLSSKGDQYPLPLATHRAPADWADADARPPETNAT